MRILLATEGPSDEVVAQQLIANILGGVTIDCKRFPARGFPVVQRLLNDVVRAGHFGQYELLVVHFDLDDTLPEDSTSSDQSPRWREIRSRIHQTLARLPAVPKPAVERINNDAVQINRSMARLGTPRWQRYEMGKERPDEPQEQLFGQPPRQLVNKASTLTAELIAQMTANGNWPLTLRWFIDELRDFDDIRKRGS